MGKPFTHSDDGKFQFDKFGDSCPEGERPETFNFKCPRGRGFCSGLVIRTAENPGSGAGGCPSWQWDGNVQKPTFAPSINCGGCGWHGYIERGIFLTTAKTPEPNQG